MKLILASQGFTTPEVAQATADLASKPLEELHVAIINEAYVANKVGSDQKWLINELSLIPKYAKGTIAFVNLRAYDITEIKQRLAFADVIYIVGGQQIILPKLFRETGFDKLLLELVEHKVIFGTSAGAMVLGQHIQDQAYWQDQYGSSDEFMAEPSLGLVNFNILPHFARPDHPKRIKEIVTPLLKENPFPLYGVTDTQAVLYNDGNISFIGGDPVLFGNTA